MPRGNPDYGVRENEIAKSTDYEDVILVSTRGVNSVDGLGRLYYFDDFKEGIQSWGRTGLNGGTAPILKYGKSEIGDYAVFHDAGTNTGNGHSAIDKSFWLNGGVKIGVEFTFEFGYQRPDTILGVIIQSNGVSLEGRVKIGYDNKLYLRNAAGAYEQFSEITLDATTPNFMPIKVVIDTVSKTYDRVIIGQTRYENFSIVPEENAPTTKSKISISIDAISQGVNNRDLTVGHIIVTTDEP